MMRYIHNLNLWTSQDQRNQLPTHSSPPSNVPTAAQKARRKSQPCHELAVSQHSGSQAKRWANSGIAIIVKVIFKGKDRRFGGLSSSSSMFISTVINIKTYDVIYGTRR